MQGFRRRLGGPSLFRCRSQPRCRRSGLPRLQKTAPCADWPSRGRRDSSSECLHCGTRICTGVPFPIQLSFIYQLRAVFLKPAQIFLCETPLEHLPGRLFMGVQNTSLPSASDAGSVSKISFWHFSQIISVSSEPLVFGVTLWENFPCQEISRQTAVPLSAAGDPFAHGKGKENGV